MSREKSSPFFLDLSELFMPLAPRGAVGDGGIVVSALLPWRGEEGNRTRGEGDHEKRGKQGFSISRP